MKKVKELLAEIYINDLEGPLDKIIENLNEHKQTHKNYEDLTLAAWWDYDDFHYLSLYGTREENEKERKKRLDKAKKEREKKKKLDEGKKEKELKELARLKKKYE